MKGNAQLLAAKRKALRWSRERLGREIGKTAKTVENHEKLVHPISHEMVVLYAQAMGCRPEELAEPEAPNARPERKSPMVYPRSVFALLRARRDLDVSDEEAAELARYAEEGNPDDVDSLELELLMRRASRTQSDDALKDYFAAVNRRRVAAGMQPWRPSPPPPQPKVPQRGQKSRA